MPTLFAVYNARNAEKADEYERYLKDKKVPFVRSKPFVVSFDVYRVDQVVGPGVADPQNTPTEPPYQFIARIEVSSLEEFGKANQSEEMKSFIQEYTPLLEPSMVFTAAHKVEP